MPSYQSLLRPDSSFIQHWVCGAYNCFSERHADTTTSTQFHVRWSSGVLARLKILPAYQTENRTYSNTQLPKRGFDAQESTPRGGTARPASSPAPDICSRFRNPFFFFSSWRIGGLSVHDKRLGSLAQVEVTPFPPRSYLLIRTIGPYRGTAQYP